MRKTIAVLIATAFAVAPMVVAPTIAQMMGEGPSGPIDIQAETQEFSGDEVIAKGNVRVNYKDSTIAAPMARLIRDAGGNPQKAVFTGHPRLTQGQNKIDADTLTFEIANSRIIAEGRAHSEVVSNSSEGGAKKAAPEAVVDRTAGSDKATLATTSAPKPKEAPERIITDADRQEYDRASGKFEAVGHVHVVHGNITVKADKLQLVYGTDNKPETAVFTGNVNATQDRNSTLADNMTYSLATKRLQATGHVRSTVIQEKKEGKKKLSLLDSGGMQAAHATSSKDDSKEETITIVSETQDYSKPTGRMSASGSVKIFYGDTVGAGPNVVLTTNSEGKADRIVFTGRSQISQPGKRWIADRIEFTVADKKVLATGNTKAFILQKNTTSPMTVPDFNLGGIARKEKKSPRTM